VAQRQVMIVGDGDFAFTKEIVEHFQHISSTSTTELHTSIFLERREAIERYKGGSILDHLETLRGHGIQHAFAVDATRLAETAAWKGKESCNTIIWTYPFPESNAVGIETKHCLVKSFFASVKHWPSFKADGTIVIGLKSCTTTARHINKDEDYQLKQWQVLDAAKEEGFHQVSDFGPVYPFWRATHVCGRALFKEKDRQKVTIKFYAFKADME